MNGQPSADRRVRVLLSIQRALVGRVSGNLRGVAVSWGGESVNARFIYDTTGQHRGDLMLEAETDLLADLDDVATTLTEETAG